MTCEEFSNEFDTLINAYSRIEEFGTQQDPLKFDEYEKSVFLTQALELVVVSLYNGTLLGNAFELTEEIRRYLADLIRTVELFPLADLKGISSKSKFFKLPSDLLFITYELAKLSSNNKCIDNKEIEVIPTTLDEYNRVINNPFRKPNKRKALKLDLSDYMVEIVSEYNVSSYTIRYLAKPTPIVLLDLEDKLTINSINKRTECKLHPNIHRTILELAVKLAISSRATSSK